MPILCLITMFYEQLFYESKMLPVVRLCEDVVLYDTKWNNQQSEEKGVTCGPHDENKQLFDWNPEAAKRVLCMNDPIVNETFTPMEEEDSFQMENYFESMFLGEQNLTEQSLPFPDLNDIFGEVNICPEENENKGKGPIDDGFKLSPQRRSNRKKTKQTVCYLCEEIHK